MFYFSKMQATGNDFIILDCISNNFNYSLKLLSKYLCDRHYGVGADGIIIIEKSKIADYKMRIINKDGSEAEMCGNGIRCFSKYLYEKNYIQKEKINVETLAGLKEVNLYIEGNTVSFVKVNMGIPIYDSEKIPVYCKENAINIEDKMYYPVSIGNPHVVTFIKNIDEIDIENIGKKVENYKYFPNKTNVEFVEIINEKNIKVRVWERGVGETLACGTGACAAAVISKRIKSTNDELIVDLPGGKLNITHKNNEIYIEGTAEFVFEGKIKI